MLGCGVIQRKAREPAACPARRAGAQWCAGACMEHSRLTVQIVEDAQRPAEAGWAFGLGLERLAMVRTDPSIAA